MKLMLGIAAARERLNNRTLSKIGFVRTICNVAHRLEEFMIQAVLRQMKGTGLHYVRLEQWKHLC